MKVCLIFKSTLCFFLSLISFTTLAQIACIDGFAGDYPCKNVELLGHLTPEALGAEEHQGVWLNDVWGWTDPETGREYALVGMANGTSFVDISDPINPELVGVLLEHGHHSGASRQKSGKIFHDDKGEKSIWRDIKVYNNHAFVVSEDEGHGMQVFDLFQLREIENAPVYFEETAHYDGISNAHNIVINEETGYAFAVGATKGGGNCIGGGLHIIDIRDPINPVFAGCFDVDGYTHDAQCIVYNGLDTEHIGKEICFSSNVNAITLVDVSDKSNPKMISRQGYDKSGYIHQGWLTEDQQYFISNDELDELYNGNKTTSYIWDVRDLDNPVMIGKYIGPNPSIDHNLFIRGALVYQTNYSSGLQVLNLTGIGEGILKEVAYFDTYPENNEPNFEGAWSNYPYFESGVVVVSDITNGLFILKPTLDLLSNDPEDILACNEGEAALYAFPNKLNVAYQWQINIGEGFTDLEDNETYSGVKERRLQINGVSEEMEAFQYRVKVMDTENLYEYVSGEAKILVNSGNPIAAFTYEWENGLYTFTNLSENAELYNWSFGDFSPIVNVKDPKHIYEFGGGFDVVLEAVNGCGTDIYKERIFVVTSVEEEDVSESLTLFPNPTEGIINLRFNNNSQKVQSISLYNIKGSKVFQQKIALANQQNEYVFDISTYGKGVYFMKITSENSSTVRRVLVK